MKCPMSHELPHVYNGVNCSPSYCAQAKFKAIVPEEPKKNPRRVTTGKKVAESAKATAQARVDLTVALSKSGSELDAMELPEEARTVTSELVLKAKAAEIERLAKAAGRLEGRRALMKTPKGLGGEDAKGYVEKRLDQMLPDAVDRVAYELLCGDDRGSLEAAYEVLDRKGFGRKEANPTQGAPIIVQINNVPEGGTYKPAWLSTVNNKGDK